MYLKKIVCENMGPISVADITPGFHPNGNPKPLIVVGKNGTGKSILISNIVDSFFELGNQAYGDVAKKTGLSNLYFKIAASNQIQIGKKSMICHLDYTMDDKSHPLSFYTYYQDIFAKDSPHKEPNDIVYYNNHYGEKSVNRSKEKDFTPNVSLFKKEFDKNVLVFFPPERFFVPYWMGTAYSVAHDYGSIMLQNRYNNELNKPIIAYNSTEDNTRWLLDILIDAKAEIDVVSERDVRAYNNIPTLIFFDNSKKSIEKVLSCIMNQDVLLRLGLRNAGKTRLSIISAQENKPIVPTIDALSTGQMVLLNMFLTIIRYAERNDLRKCNSPEEITGIVVIDEIELHLHSDLQGSALPRLIQMFPKVQFIITSHSPLFLLGMQDVFSDDGFDIVEMPDGKPIKAESFSEFQKDYAIIAETQAFQNEIAKIRQESANNNEKALVITEGPSDWKHMKRAWNKLKDSPEYAPIADKFEFLEYEPSQKSCSDTNNTDIGGGSKLKNMLDMFSKIPNKRRLIFVADRDVPDIVKRFTENGKPKHHMAGKYDSNVFSFVIPVPKHREQENICIEHYYTDEEIRTPKEIDGLKRHLFLGVDFNDCGFGQGPYSEYYCDHVMSQGKKKKTIIDGGNNAKVTLLSQKGNGPNYALSKLAFAEAILNEEGEFANISSESFRLIFDVLLEIIAPGSNTSTEMTSSADKGNKPAQ